MKKMQEQEFSDAFNGKEAPAMDAPNMNAQAEEAPMSAQDEMPAEPADMPTEAAEPAIDTESKAEDATEPAVVAEEGAEMPAEDAISMDEEKSPEDIQREKSWEGRLRKREEELAAREASMSESGEAEGASESLAKLSEQFGSDFADLMVKVIKEVTGGAAAGGVDSLREEVSEVISDLKFAMHKRDILAAKSDAYDIGETPEFQEWCAGQDDADECKRIVEGGTSVEVIELLTRYEKSLKDGESDDMDSATSVRGSAPISLPNKPAVNADDEYSAAWNSM